MVALLLLAHCAAPASEAVPDNAPVALSTGSAGEELPLPPFPPALAEISWNRLPGWRQDPLAEALPALREQCTAGRIPSAPPGGDGPIAGPSLADADWWRAFCASAARLGPAAHAAFRRLIEARFQPVQVTAPGLLTGYFEPVYRACPDRGPGCETPVRGRPPGLVDVDLRRFEPAAAPRRLRGCVEAGALARCPDRAGIEAGGWPAAPVLAWMDATDKFFMQIQGSGRLLLADGRVLRLGYAAQNGSAYVPIGRLLLESGELARPVSMQSIRAWLVANPDQAPGLLNRNPSYVFFRALDLPDAVGPIGALGVPLTAQRSVAIDPRQVPLGLPVFLAADGVRPRLAFAQDTGGAITGAGRADLFLGTGPEAGEVAGRLVADSTLFVLVPRLGESPPAR